MCSGCSGDYDGEFDDDGEPAADSVSGDHLAWNCGEAQGDGNWLGRAPGHSFEAKASSEKTSQSASLSGSGDESAGEFCEILVSATRIIEIRVITPNPEGIKEFRKG
jgi:hypothetical protein